MRRICSFFLLCALLEGGGAQASSEVAQSPSAGASAPLALTDALATALSRSPQVRGAGETARAAAARIGEATAPWLPQLNLTALGRGDYSYQTGLPDGAGVPSTSSARYSAQAQLSQLLYDFGRTGARIGAARAGAQAAASDWDTTRAQVALQAASGFFAVLQAEALREVNRRNVDQQQQRLQQAESFYKIGTRPEIDVLIARTAVASAELQLVQAQNNIWVARAQFLESMGLSGSDWPIWLQRPLVPPAPTPLGIETPEMLSSPERSVDELLDEALTRRPEYRAARARLLQSEQQLRAVRADYLPQLSVSGTASLGGSLGNSSAISLGGSSGMTTAVTPSLIAGQPAIGLSGLVTLSWPLLSGLNTLYSVREARALLGAADATLEALRLDVRSQLLIAIYQLATAHRTLAAASVLVLQAEKQLQMARGRYKAGVGNAIELGDAEISAMTAQAQRVQAESALGLTRATLRWHLGLLVPFGAS